MGQTIEQTIGIYKTASQACNEWACDWGLSVAYAITQSLDTAEQALAEAIIALMAARAEAPASDAGEYMVRFAQKLWIQAEPKSHIRTLANDDFFRLAPVIRAAVILKIKAKLSRRQIAAALSTNEDAVEKMLEAARLSYTKGKPWLANGSFKRQLDDAKLVAPCPNPLDGRLYARYLESDLTGEDVLQLHRHFVGCTPCRTNLTQFKNTYSDWLFTLPEPDVTKASRAFVQKMVNMGRKASETQRKEKGPSPLPGLKVLMTDRYSQILVLSFLLFVFMVQVFRAS